jgi:hypothetical protein
MCYIIIISQLLIQRKTILLPIELFFLTNSFFMVFPGILNSSLVIYAAFLGVYGDSSLISSLPEDEEEDEGEDERMEDRLGEDLSESVAAESDT